MSSRVTQYRMSDILTETHPENQIPNDEEDTINVDDAASESPKSDKSSDEKEESNQEDEASPFECNICFDEPNQPVVTICGHLYCWPCIYRWINSGRSVITCPVCKSSISKEKIIPIYGRGGGDVKDPRETVPQDEEVIPPRPMGQRVEAPQRPQINPLLFGHHGGRANFTFSAGIGPVGLFGMQFNHGNQPLTAQEQTNMNVSKFMLIVAFAVLFFIHFL